MSNNRKNAVQRPVMSSEAFGAAIGIAKKAIQKNSACVDNMDVLIAFVENEVSEKFVLTVDELKGVPKAIAVAQKSIANRLAKQAQDLAHVKAEIVAATPGLTVPRSKDFEGNVTLSDGNIASPGLVGRACMEIDKERTKIFRDFVYNTDSDEGLKVFESHYRGLLEQAFPGTTYMEGRRLPEFMFYQLRSLPKQAEQLVKNLFFRMREERKAAREAAFAEKKNVELEKNWRARAIIWVSKQALIDLNDGKEFSRLAFGKKMSKASFDDLPLPKDVVKEGMQRALNIKELGISGGQKKEPERAVLIKRA